MEKNNVAVAAANAASIVSAAITLLLASTLIPGTYRIKKQLSFLELNLTLNLALPNIPCHVLISNASEITIKMLCLNNIEPKEQHFLKKKNIANLAMHRIQDKSRQRPCHEKKKENSFEFAKIAVYHIIMYEFHFVLA